MFVKASRERRLNKLAVVKRFSDELPNELENVNAVAFQMNLIVGNVGFSGLGNFKQRPVGVEDFL